jgi:c-Rel proto-oncogene protein
MLPLNEGKRSFWNLQRELKKRSASTDLFQQLLDVDNEEQKVEFVNFSNVNSLPLQSNMNHTEVVLLDTPVEENSQPIEDKTMTMHWLEHAEFIMDGNNNENNQNIINQSDDDKTLSDLLEQVAELDVIYQHHQVRKQNEMAMEEMSNMDQCLPNDGEHMETDFDDAATYSSLQKAFKHPIVFTDAPPLPPKPGHVFDGTTFDLVLPPIVINPATPELFFKDEKLPPLPPKRAKKFSESGDKENIVLEQFPIQVVELDECNLVRNNSTRSLTPRPQQQIVIKSADLRRSPSHKLPPKSPTKSTSSASSAAAVPQTNTLPKQKKPGFFSKIFSRRKSKSDIDSSVADSASIKIECEMEQPEDEMIDDVENHFEPEEDQNRISVRSAKSLRSPKKQKYGKPVGRSVSSVSGKRPHLTPDIIHIPLKGDSSNSLPLHQSGSATHLSLPGNDFYERASTASLHPIDRKTMSALQLAEVPIQDGDMELVAIADAQSLRNLCGNGELGIILDPSVDLTEAEHYALYTTLAPHATESEFDETSCYYQPVEAGQILTPAEVATRRLNGNF